MMKNNKKGFTLIELLVVVLIIGILAAMALPAYFKAVERSRMSEAVSLLNSIGQAQQRKWLQINKYATKYSGLDVSPSNEASKTFHTKGESGNGFKIELNDTATDIVKFGKGKAVATRENGGNSANIQYGYTLTRYYQSPDIECTATTDDAKSLCADFCGIDDLGGKSSCCNNGGAEHCTEPTVGGASVGGSSGGAGGA